MSKSVTPWSLWTAGLLVTAGFACSPDGPSVGDEPVRIGVIVSLSGSLESVGEHLRQSAQLAAREANAAGGVLGGRPIELIIKDDRTDADHAALVARELLDEGVVAIVGSLGSSASLAVQSITLAAQIPQVSCCSTSLELTDAQPEGDRYLFRTVSSDLLQARVTSRITAVSQNCQRLAILHINDAYGSPFATSIQVGYESLTDTGMVVVVEPFEKEQADYVAAVSAVAATNPDCIALVGFPDEGGRILRDWTALGTRPENVTWIASDGLKDPGFPEEAGDAMIVDGVIGTAPINTPATATFNNFAANFRASFSATPGIFGGHQYDAMMLTILAIEAAGTTDGTAIRDALFRVSAAPDGSLIEPTDLPEAFQRLREGREINYNGASGPVDFDSHGDVLADYEIWRYEAATETFVQDMVIRGSEL